MTILRLRLGYVYPSILKAVLFIAKDAIILKPGTKKAVMNLLLIL